MLSSESDGELASHLVEDRADGPFEGSKTSVGFWPEPFVFDFAPQGFDFVEVGAVGGQVKDKHVPFLPGRQARPKGSGMVQAGVVEHEHRGPGARGHPGLERVEHKGPVQGAFAGGRVQLVGGRVIETQHVKPLRMTGLRGDLFARELPAVGQGRGQAETRLVAVVQVDMALLFQGLQLGQALGFVAVVGRVLGRFQAVAEAAEAPTKLFKKRRSVVGENDLSNSWRNVAVTSLSCWRLASTAARTGASSASVSVGLRPCPAALASPASPPVSQRSNQAYTVTRLTPSTVCSLATSSPSALNSNAWQRARNWYCRWWWRPASSVIRSSDVRFTKRLCIHKATCKELSK